MIKSFSTEKTGWPTQKPLALLSRIIKASSNKGDLVLDPFCGCATACVASENLGRQWIGIDIAPKAAEILRDRLEADIDFDFGTVAHDVEFHYPSERQSALPEPEPAKPAVRHYREHKPELYGRQRGRCVLCLNLTDYDIMEIDHIHPRNHADTYRGADINELANLQLLCGPCNRPQGYKVAS